MRISVSKIMSFSSTFRQKVRIKEYCEEIELNQKDVEAYFTLYLANVIRQRVKNSIRFQKVNGIPMRKLYEPLSETYNKTKPKANQNKFYRNTDWLYNNIKVYRYRGQYWIGFTKFQKHGNSNTLAQDVLAWNEEGTKYIPARPLIRPHLRFIMQNLTEYWYRFTYLLEKQL